MATMNIASKANQASTFPALLVATYVNESTQDSSIKINFQEVEFVKAGHDATVELSLGSATSVYGSESSIGGLVDAFPFLQSKNDGPVSTVRAFLDAI